MHQLGGAGIIQRGARPILPTVLDPQLRELTLEGRVHLYAIEVEADLFVSIYAIYGATNGDGDELAAAQTDSILQHILADCDLQPKGPKLIVGDLNASLHSLPAIEAAIKDDLFTNVGSIASSYGGIDDEHTCKASPHAKATVRDYVITNPAALDLIQGFHIDHGSGLPVHSIITLTFKNKVQRDTFQAVRLPSALDKVVEKRGIDKFGEQNIQRAKTKVANNEAQNRKIHCHVELPESSSFPPVAEAI